MGDDPLRREDLLEAVQSDRPREGLWYHATGREFARFEAAPAVCRTQDWNASLGIHFTRDGEGAYDYIACAESNGRVLSARLALENPARFGHEFELDHFAIGLLRQAGLFEPASPITPAGFAEALQTNKPLVERFSRWLESADSDSDDPRCFFRLNVFDAVRGPEAARLVRAELESRGHDGIVYGNVIDWPSVCAIAFRPTQVEIIEHACPFGWGDPEPDLVLTLLPA